MFVVIAGGGLVGSSVAQVLVENRHDVVVIDREPAVCEHIAARIGALAIHGTATDIEVLEDAGVRKAEVAVAAMPTDADNLAFSLLARNFGVPRIIVRMRNPRYEAAYKSAGVTRVINVRDLFVRQLVLEIEQPALRQVATFGRGKASIVVAIVPPDSVVHGKTVEQVVQTKEFPNECIIAGIFRQEPAEFIIPRGGVEIRSGDQVFLVADIGNVRKAVKVLQRTRWRRVRRREAPVRNESPAQEPPPSEPPSQSPPREEQLPDTPEGE